MKNLVGPLKPLLVFGLINFLPATSAWASAATEGGCNTLLSREAVEGRYADLLENATSATTALPEMGIQNPGLIAEISKISYLSNVSIQDSGQKVLDVVVIKSPEGIPDGDEIEPGVIVTLAHLSNVTGQEVHDLFQQTLEFLPLLSGKVGSSDAATALLKLSVFYTQTPAQTVAKLDEFNAASQPLREKVSALVKEHLKTANGLFQTLLKAVGAENGQIAPELVIASLEATFATKRPVTDGIQALDKMVDHEQAGRYTIHEQAAMLKALVIHGQSLDDSVAKLKVLDEGAKERFGTGLAEAIERPAVNLILLGGQKPEDVLNMLGHMTEVGAGYTASAAALVLNKALRELSVAHPHQTLLEAAVVIPE